MKLSLPDGKASLALALLTLASPSFAQAPHRAESSSAARNSEVLDPTRWEEAPFGLIRGRVSEEPPYPGYDGGGVTVVDQSDPRATRFSMSFQSNGWVVGTPPGLEPGQEYWFVLANMVNLGSAPDLFCKAFWPVGKDHQLDLRFEQLLHSRSYYLRVLDPVNGGSVLFQSRDFPEATTLVGYADGAPTWSQRIEGAPASGIIQIFGASGGEAVFDWQNKVREQPVLLVQTPLSLASDNSLGLYPGVYTSYNFISLADGRLLYRGLNCSECYNTHNDDGRPSVREELYDFEGHLIRLAIGGDLRYDPDPAKEEPDNFRVERTFDQKGFLTEERRLVTFPLCGCAVRTKLDWQPDPRPPVLP
ncbi:MAG: hypothetical protein K1X83_14840 [Oligoflexia bacterium]|nr:hypothetical protein [Oligoflexia bacterium]